MKQRFSLEPKIGKFSYIPSNYRTEHLINTNFSNCIQLHSISLNKIPQGNILGDLKPNNLNAYFRFFILRTTFASKQCEAPLLAGNNPPLRWYQF